MSAYLVLFTISSSLSPHISDQVHMASLHSSGQKYLNSNFWISYMYFLWTECPCCPFTWWIEFMPRGASDNYTKASTNKAVFLSSKLACWSWSYTFFVRHCWPESMHTFESQPQFSMLFCNTQIYYTSFYMSPF